MITVLYMPVQGQPEKREIDGSLESMQKLVNGNIQVDIHNPFAHLLSAGAEQNPGSFSDQIKFLLPTTDVRFQPCILLVCNEDFIRLELEPNQNVDGICGNCFLIRNQDLK